MILNLLLVNQCRLADARTRCGRAGEAVPLLQQALSRSTARVEPENVDYARMLLADAWMEAGVADDERIRLLLEESLACCRGRLKRRPLLMALAVEMERRARPGCPDPLEPVSDELDAVVAASAEPLDPEIPIRASLARAAYRLARGDAEASRREAELAAAAARSHGAAAFEARAKSVLARALARLGRDEEARAATVAGRELLSEAASRIENEAVRADLLRRPAFAALQEEEPTAGREADRRLSALYDMIRVAELRDRSRRRSSRRSSTWRCARSSAERGMILLKEEGETAAARSSPSGSREDSRRRPCGTPSRTAGAW